MKNPIVPYGLEQNPAPSQLSGQEYLTQKKNLVADLMEAFRLILPSNYVAQTNGPWYSLQFQAMLEQLADAQLSANEVFKDSYWDLTRPEYLWQVLGTLVFPSGDVPQIDGDKNYRDFLRGMAELLLQGSKVSSMKEGLQLLDPEATIQIIEKYLSTPPRLPDGGNTLLDQFGVEIFVQGAGNSFPGDPFVFQENAQKVLVALKPAHVIYTFSYLFTDSINPPSDESGLFFQIENYYYDDVRKYQWGATEITGTGEILSDRGRLRDPSLSFGAISPGATLAIGLARYRVTSVVGFSQVDLTPRAYTTSSGLTGFLTVTSLLEVLDPAQNWGLAGENEILTIPTGPNAGSYRLEFVLGADGGPILTPGTLSGNRARISPGTLKFTPKAPSAGSVTYSVGVDRLGTQKPNPITNEDVSLQFFL